MQDNFLMSDETSPRPGMKRAEHVKPQESYIAMISSAILSTPEKRMTLSEIIEYLKKNYECFRGEYQGWKNSVRHNLSFNKCFVKILRKPTRSWGKNNYWGVVVSLLQDYLREDGKFRRRRKRQVTNTSRKQNRPSDYGYVCVSGRNEQTSYQGHFTGYPQILSAQARGVVEEHRPLNRYMGAFSIDSILRSTQQTNRQALGCLPGGWIELTTSSRYFTSTIQCFVS